jgi:hypothetical protein
MADEDEMTNEDNGKYKGKTERRIKCKKERKLEKKKKGRETKDGDVSRLATAGTQELRRSFRPWTPNMIHGP